LFDRFFRPVIIPPQLEPISRARINIVIPVSVIRRLPKYLALAQVLQEDDRKWVSSGEISKFLGLTSSTVRQDLSHLDCTGVSRRGYEIEELDRTFSSVLGLNEGLNVLIVGAGNLGRALTLHGRFQQKGFKICGVIDSEPSLIGQKVGGLEIQGMGAMQDVVRSEKIDIGIIAAPADVAQEISGRLVISGIRGILNLSGRHVHVSEEVPVVDVRLLASLQELAYAIKTRGRDNKKQE